jgi:hypothetical protein
MCGAISFDLFAPLALSSPGEFAAGVGALAPTGPGCTGVPAQPCGLEALAGDHKLLLITEVQISLEAPPSEVTLHLEANPLVCLTGHVESRLSPGQRLGYVRSVTPGAAEARIELLSFRIPPGISPTLPNGGTGDFELRSQMRLGDDGLCGQLDFQLFDPFVLTTTGAFNFGRVGVREPASPECPAALSGAAAAGRSN